MELEKYVVFVLDKGPDDLEKIFLEKSKFPVELTFVYDCKSVEECDAVAELQCKYLAIYLIYDNKWLDGKPYPQMRMMSTGETFRFPYTDIWRNIVSLTSGTEFTDDLMEYYEESLSGAKFVEYDK